MSVKQTADEAKKPHLLQERRLLSHRGIFQAQSFDGFELFHNAFVTGAGVAF